MPPTALDVTTVPQDSPAPSRGWLDRIESSSLACEYQPILRAADEVIWGYEALARFRVGGREIAPDDVFKALHHQRQRFFELETRSKRFQIANRPSGANLFVNLDPDVCETPSQLSHWVAELGGEPGLVVEIIENTTVTNLDNIRRFTRSMNANGVSVALDDIGGSKNLFSFDLLDDVSFLKLDRRWFERLDGDTSYRALIGGLVAFAKAKQIHTVIEGVESRRHLSIARSLEIDFVQGFLFRDHFVRVAG